MKKSYLFTLISFAVILVSLAFFIATLPIKKLDLDMLYEKNLGDITYKIKKYDDALGQKLLIGVEKSENKGKSYEPITEELVSITDKATYVILNDNLIIINTKGYVERDSNFLGLKVSIDGGKTFKDAKFTYKNKNVNYIKLPNLPYFEENILKIKGTVYDLTKNKKGYEYKDIIFESKDQGLSWNIESKKK